MSYCLPENYNMRLRHEHYLDVPGEFVYQPYVYDAAIFIAEKCAAKYIIDIGCGSAVKLGKFSSRFKFIGIDSSAAISLAKNALPKAHFIEWDLEEGLPEIDHSVLECSVVICSDVVEHLRYPDRLLRSLARVSKIAPFVLISTPDRDRARGWLDNGPPLNPAHVMEWSGGEFVRFMKSCGFDDIPFCGHTINTDFHRVKSTILTICGKHAVIMQDGKKFQVAAVIHTYNEEDVIAETIEHLISEGIDVHVFDNWSNDNTWNILIELRKNGKIVNLERFPESPTNDYIWKEQLKKTADYSKILNVDWVMHQDADEIRKSPWAKIKLRDALLSVDLLGYNAVDFTVIDFRYLNNYSDLNAPYQNNLNFFEFGRRPGHFKQIKAWKNEVAVDLDSSGGHESDFEGRLVYPIKFLLKHYPLRNRIQAKKKVLQDRLPRFALENSRFGWHTQYDNILNSNQLDGWASNYLISWHENLFFTEYLVERLTGIGVGGGVID